MGSHRHGTDLAEGADLAGARGGDADAAAPASRRLAGDADALAPTDALPIPEALQEV